MMMSNPCPPVSPTAAAMCSGSRWSTTRTSPWAATSSLPASLPAVPTTVRPAARASWTVAMPTAPLAPWTSTRSPGRGSARWTIAL